MVAINGIRDSGEPMKDRKSTTNDLHFTSGGGRIRPVENLRVPKGSTPLVSSFPSAPAPLRGGGVDVEEWSVVVMVPFIVVVGRPLAVGISLGTRRNQIRERDTTQPKLICLAHSDRQQPSTLGFYGAFVCIVSDS